ncbi:MAG: type II toxin-antitoxin system VapC family toxin [Rhizomicrobium sp.]
MRLLLDTNIVVPLTRRETHGLNAKINLLLASRANDLFVSAASLWEIAIKTRLGKLDPGTSLADIPAYLFALEIETIMVNSHHALEELWEVPDTRDPFDLLLIAQCQVENLFLVTADRALNAHPLAWRER